MSTETENNLNSSSLNTNEFGIAREAMGDWNDYGNETGFYTGHAMNNSPCEMEANNDYWYVTNICMSIDSFATQTAINAFTKETFIRNRENGVWKEWSKLGNGCDADTLDGKHASDFAPSGYGLGLTCRNIVNYDLNNLPKDVDATGFFMGGNLKNAPFNNPAWWYIIQLKHNENYKLQIAINLNTKNYEGKMFTRNFYTGNWAAWNCINDNGNAHTVDSKHAIQFAPSGYGLGSTCRIITNHDLNDMPNIASDNVRQTGFYMGEKLAHAPYDNNEWWYIIQLYHNDNYMVQIAIGLSNQQYDGKIFTRNLYKTVWGDWNCINDNGNAKTLEGRNASDFATSEDVKDLKDKIKALKELIQSW